MSAPDQIIHSSTWQQLQFLFDRRLHIRLESLIVLGILCAAMAILSPFFFSVSNFLNILLATSTIGDTTTVGTATPGVSTVLVE